MQNWQHIAERRGGGVALSGAAAAERRSRATRSAAGAAVAERHGGAATEAAVAELTERRGAVRQ